jgi:hypothetical protein
MTRQQWLFMPMPGNLEIAIAIASAVFLVVAAITFFVAAKRRAAIDAALRSGPGVKRLGMFDLAHHDAMKRLDANHLAIPERLWTYDNFYLEKFAKAARQARLPGGGTALDSYIGMAMIFDIVFAAALGLSVALFEFDVASLLLPECPLFGGAVMFFACMGAVYGAADVAEDLKLMSILKDWRNANAGDAEARISIDGGEAAAANALTRIKIVTISLSVLGVVVFLFFSLAAAAIYRKPHNPAPLPPENLISTAG